MNQKSKIRQCIWTRGLGSAIPEVLDHSKIVTELLLLAVWYLIEEGYCGTV